eukprot:4056173-Ditylum_brightwellii.AAC.1
MAPKAKKIQWHNAIQNHQNGEPLPVLDPKVKGYEPVELYQWEMCVQFYLRSVSEIIPTTDVGDKIINLVVKLHEAHNNDFLIFMEDVKLIKLETFPQKAPEIKKLLNCVVHDRYKNISLVLHMMSPKMFAEFKKLMISWLQMNKFFMNKTIFKSSKDTTVCIGHLKNINPFRISRPQYREHINVLIWRQQIKKR